MKSTRLFSLLTSLTLLAALLAGCNLPSSDTPTPASIAPPDGKLPVVVTATRAPATSAPDVLKSPTLTGPPRTPTSTAGATAAPTATLQPTPGVNRKDAQAVINAVRQMLDQRTSAPLEPFLSPNGVGYVNYIEGGQPNERAKFLDDLKTRLPGGLLECEAFGTYDNVLQVWTSGWAPDWQMERMCYQSCSDITPPWKSSRAAFFFGTNQQGEYELQSVWLNKDTLWQDVYKVQMHACSEPYSSAVTLACPGTPKTRLKVGDYAYANTATSASNRLRSAPGTGANILGLIQPGKAVQVLGGPECADGYLWWRVKPLSGTLTGWTAEGAGSDYYLVPCSGPGKCGSE